MSDRIDRLAASFSDLLSGLDPSPSRAGIAETPVRAAKAWAFYCSGYDMDARAILKTFEDGAEACDEMVTVKGIPVYSHCEHHLAAIFGTATVSYIPDGKIVGLSKLTRLVDMHARRLQVQERLTNDVANDLYTILGCKGVGVRLECRHMCMEARGVRTAGSVTVTTSVRGVYKDLPETRREFLAHF